MTPLFTTAYWFSLTPPALSKGGMMIMLSVFGAMILAAIVLKLVSKRKKDTLAWAKGAPKFVALLGWMGVFGLLMVWTSYEQIRFFGARFWFLVWDAVTIVWLLSILKFIIAVVPEQAAAYAERERIRKYLPTKS